MKLAKSFKFSLQAVITLKERKIDYLQRQMRERLQNVNKLESNLKAYEDNLSTLTQNKNEIFKDVSQIPFYTTQTDNLRRIIDDIQQKILIARKELRPEAEQLNKLFKEKISLNNLKEKELKKFKKKQLKKEQKLMDELGTTAKACKMLF